MPATSQSTRSSARIRLLDAADELFYNEGVHTVGIDRIIEHAGVAKASLYNSFRGKDELIAAYLQRRHQARVERLTAAIEPHEGAREKLLAVFDAQVALLSSPTYRGCAFVNASAESTSGRVQEASDVYRGWIRSLFTDLATEAGAPDPARLAAQLVVLYDGAMTGARMDRDPAAGSIARDMAATLIAAALD